jgi:hypothetical protein
MIVDRIYGPVQDQHGPGRTAPSVDHRTLLVHGSNLLRSLAPTLAAEGTSYGLQLGPVMVDRRPQSERRARVGCNHGVPAASLRTKL